MRERLGRRYLHDDAAAADLAVDPELGRAWAKPHAADLDLAEGAGDDECNVGIDRAAPEVVAAAARHADVFDEAGEREIDERARVVEAGVRYATAQANAVILKGAGSVFQAVSPAFRSQTFVLTLG